MLMTYVPITISVTVMYTTNTDGKVNLRETKLTLPWRNEHGLALSGSPHHAHHIICIQWTPSNTDTLGQLMCVVFRDEYDVRTWSSVLIREVSFLSLGMFHCTPHNSI